MKKLCVFLLLIGIDTGGEGTLVENFKTAGFRILLFPFISIAAMCIAAFIAAPILGLSIKDSLCVGCGMGWYSLAPAMIADYSLKISAIAFIHNVLREIISIILIPVVADKLGFIESYGLGGATGMDVTLPVVARATSSEVAMYSFICGAVVSASVPVITSLILAL
ncbi:MAG: lysine exporter LysO family protein [Firmicutes bacterium]|nr:lysine exporter LysO family protein [Bacillota bacterium]